jgi:hypothetical protein
MMNKNLFCVYLTLVLLFFSSQTLFAQKGKALRYYSFINKAELSICDSNLKAAHQYYKKAFEINPDKAFSFDLFHAFSCAVDVKEYQTAELYLRQLMARGISPTFPRGWFNGYSNQDSAWMAGIIKKYYHDTTRFHHEIRTSVDQMMKWDQNVRAYYSKFHSDGNYMQDSVYTADYTNAVRLKALFAKYGNTLPGEGMLGSFWGNPPYGTLILHHLSGKSGGRPYTLFDSMMYQGIFSFDCHPSFFASTFSMHIEDDSMFRYKEEYIKFPISIIIGVFDNRIYPEYFDAEKETRINNERQKTGLCSLDDARRKLWFAELRKHNTGGLSKYVFLTDLSNRAAGGTEEEIMEWDKKNMPYKKNDH